MLTQRHGESTNELTDWPEADLDLHRHQLLWEGRPMKLASLLCAATMMLSAGAAAAQEFPTQPITVVVPFAAGGPTDTVTRLIAEPMGKELGQQIVVQNVAGAGGTLASGQVAKASPDGYTS
jgi:tripartite-type tricarboxylate transporter receptor subunit TctC